MPGQQVEHLVELGEPAAGDRAPEHTLVAEVVAVRVELESAVAHVRGLQRGPQARRRVAEVHAHAGEHARELLHVGLRVAAVDTERVQLEQLAGMVLVEAAGRVLLVVEVAQHRRMAGGRAEQVAEAPERMRADRAVLVVADHRAQVRLALEHVEVVRPEPGHPLAQLLGRMEREQQRA